MADVVTAWHPDKRPRIEYVRRAVPPKIRIVGVRARGYVAQRSRTVLKNKPTSSRRRKIAAVIHPKTVLRPEERVHV
jgi:hypothetical protein